MSWLSKGFGLTVEVVFKKNCRSPFFDFFLSQIIVQLRDRSYNSSFFYYYNYILLLCTTPLFYNVNQWHEWKCWMRNKKGFVLPKNFCLLLFLKWTHACTQNEVNRCMSPDLARCEKYQKLRLLRKNYTLCFRPAAAGSIFIQGWNIARTERA